ncbi:hypothetical protein GCM10022267_63290 [Lentzea roselyniae]|uniref:Uncharacterized protein n=2 Tax=Lentzea roselyniae TaxID=531940 RepID=A0ABP7BTD0_9PSEU
MIERLVLPCTLSLRSAVNADVALLARWTQRAPGEVDLEVNRLIGVRTRRRATEEQLRAALRYLRERLSEAVAGGRRGERPAGRVPDGQAVAAKLARQGGLRARQGDQPPSRLGQPGTE